MLDRCAIARLLVFSLGWLDARRSERAAGLIQGGYKHKQRRETWRPP